METTLGKGDIVSFDLDDVHGESKLFKIDRGLGYIDFYWGPKAIHCKEYPIPLYKLKLISKVKDPTFTISQIREALKTSFCELD